MKKSKILSAILVLVLLTVMLVVPAMAEEGNSNVVATLGTVAYENLQAAIDDAGAGETIKLLKSIQLDTGLTVAVGKKVTLDLNGYTLSGVSATSGSSALILNNGDLTINDSSEAKTGKITTQAENPDTKWEAGFPAYANNTITNCGVLTINGGRIENTTGEGFCIPIDNNSGNRDAILTVNGGEIVHTNGNIAVRQFANSATHKNTVTVNGGLLEGKRAVWMQLPGSDTTKEMNAELVVNGGTLRSTDKGEGGYNLAVYSYTYGNSFANTKLTIKDGTIDGDIALTGGSNKTVLETISVTGGTFLGEYGVYSYGVYTEGFVSGGTFAAAPETGNYSDYLVDDFCAVLVDESYLVHKHNLTAVEAKAETCTEDGNKAHYKCDACGTLFADEKAETETTLQNVTIEAAKHKIVHVEGKDKTCTEDGVLEHWYCEVCSGDQAFLDEELTKPVDKAETVIAATGHTEVAVAGKDATCTETGLTEGKKCSVCGETTVAQKTIDVLSHKLRKVEAKEATYTEPGNIEYYICDCGKLFADAEGKKEITDVVIPQLIKVEEEKAEVSTDAVDNAIADAKEKAEETGKPVEVVIEVPKAPVVEEPEEGEETEPVQEVVKVELPVASLESVAQEEASLTVVLPSVTVTVDTEALKAVTEQAAGNTVVLSVEQVKEETLTEKQQEVVKNYDVAVTIKAEFICQETQEKIWTEDGNADKTTGSVTVKMPFTPAEGTKGTDYKVLYIADDGTVKEIETAFEDGHLVFALEHFSEYVVVNAAIKDNPATNDTTIIVPCMLLFGLSFAGVAVMVAGKKQIL